MRAFLVPLAVFVLSAAHATPVRDANCGLAAPPQDAGVDSHMGVLLKIHPRNPDIGPDYAGCQTLWAQAVDGWQAVMVVHYEAGHVVRVESPARTGDPVERCLLKGDVVLRGDPDLCARLDDMRFESLPPSCIDEPAAARCVRR